MTDIEKKTEQDFEKWLQENIGIAGSLSKVQAMELAFKTSIPLHQEIAELKEALTFKEKEYSALEKIVVSQDGLKREIEILNKRIHDMRFDQEISYSTQSRFMEKHEKLKQQLKESHEVIGFSFDELLEGVSHDNFCAGYCVSHGNEICDCSQKPLLDLIKRARTYMQKYEVKCEN